MRVNQKNTQPRLTHRFEFGAPSFTPAPMSRSKYLDGTVKAYYGPGQPPDAGTLDNYTPPADWPKAGTLLRVPQVAWLSLSVRDFDFVGYTDHTVGTYYRTYAIRVLDPTFEIWQVGDTKNPTQTDGSFPYTVMNDTGDGLIFVQASGHMNSSGDFFTQYYPDPIGDPINASGGSASPTYFYDVTIPNPYAVEYARILAIYRQVKETIEAIRPNRTWVEVIDPWIPNAPIDNRRYFQSEGFGNDVYWPMIAPKDQGTYFGTRFLHVYAGSPATSSSGPFVGVFPGFLDSIYATGYSYINRVVHPPDDTEDRDRFASYAIRVFGLKVTLEKFPAYTAPSIPTPAHPDLTVTETHGEGPLLGGTFVTDTETVPWVRYATDADISSSLASFTTSVNAQINDQNAENAIRDVAANEFLEFLADSLAEAGIDCEFMGLSDQISAPGLVNLIAEHFRFDPDTGDDLPAEE